MFKRISTAFASVMIALAMMFAAPVHAQTVQGASLVQHTATEARAATVTQTSATSAATLTFTPPAGQSVYITEIDFSNCAGGTAVTAAAPTTITTTNLTGSPAWTMGSGVTAGQCTQSFSVSYPTGLKSTVPGTAVTIILPTFATNQTIRVNAAAYYAQ